MSRTRKLLIIICALLCAVAGIIWFWWNTDTTPQDAILATATPLPNAVFYDVDPANSQLMIIVDSRFGDIEGTFAMGDGAVELLREGDAWRVIANLTFDARTLDIGNDQLNEVMRRALEVDTYPNGIFVTRSATTIPIDNTSTTIDLVGQMELHGTVRDYTISTTVTLTDTTVTLTAQHVIDAGDFGISIPALFAESELDTDLLIVTYRATP